jgi:hypothetical protein
MQVRARALVGRILLGTFAGIMLATAVAALGSLSLSHERLVEVLKEAVAADEFVSEENFTECSLVQMQFSRHPALVDDMLRSVWMLPQQMQRDHPCNTLARINSGETAELPPAVDYLNYPFGARYLLAAELSLLSFHRVRIATRILSYGSVLALALAVLWRDRRSGLVLLPAMAALLLAFGLHRFGNNVAHGPAYFVGFAILAVMVALPRTWMAPLGNRLAVFAALGALTGFFDLLIGSIPALLSLAIVLNHFVWKESGSWRSAIINAVAVAAAFSFGCIALIALRMSYLSLNDGVGWQVFFSGTAGHISGYTVFDVFLALWDYRYELTPGGAVPGGIFLGLCAAAWICAVALLMRRREAALDVFVLACSALGVLAWCAILRRHTAYHAWFTVRLLTLPAAYGVSALLIVLQSGAAHAAGKVSFGQRGVLDGEYAHR